MASLILICGLPGAGKTTLAKRLEFSRQAIRFCPDEWISAVIADASAKPELDRLRDPVERLQWKTAQKLLTLGVNIILENGFWSAQERMAYQSRAKALGARVELHCLDVPLGELWRRIEERNSVLPEDTFRITREELDTWRHGFEVPQDGELEIYDVVRVYRLGNADTP